MGQTLGSPAGGVLHRSYHLLIILSFIDLQYFCEIVISAFRIIVLGRWRLAI